MNSLLLFLILLVNMGQALALLDIKRLLKKRNDFAEEDDSVKAMTETVKKAKGRLPK